MDLSPLPTIIDIGCFDQGHCSRHFVEILRIFVPGNFFLKIENLSSVYSAFFPSPKNLDTYKASFTIQYQSSYEWLVVSYQISERQTGEEKNCSEDDKGMAWIIVFYFAKCQSNLEGPYLGFPTQQFTYHTSSSCA